MQVKPSGLSKIFTPETWLGENAAGDLVEIRKYVLGITFKREIDDPDVADKVVNKWIKYKKYTIV